MFTKHPLEIDAALDEETVFGRVHMNINAILNQIQSEAWFNRG
jgi:hypothetical protein